MKFLHDLDICLKGYSHGSPDDKGLLDTATVVSGSRWLSYLYLFVSFDDQSQFCIKWFFTFQAIFGTGNWLFGKMFLFQKLKNRKSALNRVKSLYFRKVKNFRFFNFWNKNIFNVILPKKSIRGAKNSVNVKLPGFQRKNRFIWNCNWSSKDTNR